MKSINTILKEKNVESTWRGSEKTAEKMREIIREKWGDEVASAYDPSKHVCTLKQWSRFGVRVRRGESALKTFTILENDEETGEAKRVARSVPVFHYLQTDLVPSHE